MKKTTKKLTPQHELTRKEDEFFAALKDMTRKRGKLPANGELAKELGLDPARVTRLMQMLSLKGYYVVEETVRFA